MGQLPSRDRGWHAVSRRRIARIITRLNIGGPSIQAITLSRELVAAGMDTWLIHGRLGDSEGDMRDLLSMEGAHELQVDALRRPIAPLHDVGALWRVFGALCRWRPHLVHTHMAKAGAIGRLAAVAYNRTAGRKSPARLVHTYHGHVFEGYFGSLHTRCLLAVERWLARRTDVLIAISPRVRHDLLHTFRVGTPDQVRLVPLGFDLERFVAIDPEARVRARRALGVPEGDVVVTTVGRLTAIKEQRLFLDAAAVLAARCPEARFLIAGDGELRQSLEQQAQRKGLDARVLFLGWRGDLDVVYAATDVFVLTSRNEGTPVALIEAMASGVASVSTDVGGVRDVITDSAAGTLVPFGDAGALADAVMTYVRSPSLRERTGARARESVIDRYSLARLVRDMQGVYERLLSH